ncbi:histidine ammonia-lyase [Sneathiella limimaris]|uniref:histidine ammonia-lyase n=1 Tax=Sneathiella limimaris TaxID=1964213 RepID=UPI00146F2414|nr:histidine ammonia-lyase [Sneathiella limimaris]
MTITLVPGEIKLTDLLHIYESTGPIQLDPRVIPAIKHSASLIEAAANGDDAIYGVNTGFGKLASIKIPPKDTETLQRNLILSHCCGVGEPVDAPTVRLILALKLMSLGRGASGVRMEVVRQIEALLEKEIIPVIPAQGSVGASGDLAPLAHMAAVLIGEGEAFYEGERLAGKAALEKAGVEPICLSAKEGLALINGTQTSTAFALIGLFKAWNAAQSALITGALSTDAAMGSSAPFRAEIHELRGHKGQIDAGLTLRKLMSGSEIRETHREGDTRVQDPYCIRCQPQVMGAAMDLLRQAGKTLETEANAVTDNPLVLSDGSIVSGGNFHAEPVAFAADQIAIAISEIGAIAQRRIALLVDPALSFGLPAFLSPEPGLNSGLMIAEVTSAALMSENKQLCHPASIDSTPTSANQEDHVSMACHGARRLLKMNSNLEYILGVEALTATQGIEFRAPLKTSEKLAKAISKTRSQINAVKEDRYMAPDLEKAATLISNGVLIEAVEFENLPQLAD